MYQIGEKVVHPMHGAGEIGAIEQVDGREYYVLNIPYCDMVVRVPVEGSDGLGVRRVVDRETADRVLASVDEMETDLSQNWNKRYRENLDRIKSGDLTEVVRVIKGLVARERERGLSTGERKMLHSARQILISELIFARSEPREDIERLLNVLGLM